MTERDNDIPEMPRYLLPRRGWGSRLLRSYGRLRRRNIKAAAGPFFRLRYIFLLLLLHLLEIYTLIVTLYHFTFYLHHVWYVLLAFAANTVIANTLSLARERLSQVASHFQSGKSGSITEKHPDDIVVTCALRTPITRGGKGGFKDTAAADLLVGAFKALLEKSKVDPSLVEDIAVGSVLPPGGGATEFRAAALAAGFPESTAVRSLNRQCSSGLQSIVDISNALKAGTIDIGIGAGVESMSSQYGYVSETLPREVLNASLTILLALVPSLNSLNC